MWDSGVASVLPEVLRCIDLMGQPGQQGDKAMQADIVMCLLSILYLLAPQNYQGFLHSLNGEDNIRVGPRTRAPCVLHCLMCMPLTLIMTHCYRYRYCRTHSSRYSATCRR